MTNKPVSRQSNILLQNLEKELLIYDLQNHRAYCLNPPSKMVFQLSDGSKTALEISEAVSRKLDVLFGEDLVWLALHDLERKDLLVNGKEFTDQLAGLSRRKMIKRVGLASMAALPIVASVVAPPAVHALSTLPPNSRCTVPGQCTSGSCAPTSFLPVGSFCCPPGNGGTQPGPIGTANGLNCFPSCSQAGSVCCSGSASRLTSGCDPFCALNNQFCCSCD